MWIQANRGGSGLSLTLTTLLINNHWQCRGCLCRCISAIHDAESGTAERQAHWSRFKEEKRCRSSYWACTGPGLRLSHAS